MMAVATREPVDCRVAGFADVDDDYDGPRRDGARCGADRHG